MLRLGSLLARTVRRTSSYSSPIKNHQSCLSRWRHSNGCYDAMTSMHALYEIASETILGPARCFWETRLQLNIYPFCPLRRTTLVSAFRSFASLASHTLRRLCLRDIIVCLPEERTRRIFFRTVRSHLASFNISPVWFGPLCGRPPSNGANWRRQASHG